MAQQNPYEISPAFLQAQAAGLAANNELKGLTSSADYAMALRNANKPLVEHGNPAAWGYAGPNIMNLFANMATRAEGRKNLGAIDTRAQALRDQAQKGMEAQANIEEQKRQQNFEFQREMEAARRGEAMGGLETFVGEDEVPFTVQRDRAGNIIRINELEGATPYALPRSTGKGGGKYASTVKAAKEPIEMMLNVEKIRDLADKLTSRDEETLNQLGKRILQKAFTPEQLEQYIQRNKSGYSRNVNLYLDYMLALSAEERNRLAGSALTKTENVITNAFLPSAEGITLQQRMDRIGGIHDRAYNALVALDRAADTNFSKDYAPWKRWDKPASLNDTPADTARVIQNKLEPPKPADKMALFDEYYELNGSRHPNDPRRDFGDTIGDMIGSF